MSDFVIKYKNGRRIFQYFLFVYILCFLQKHKVVCIINQQPLIRTCCQFSSQAYDLETNSCVNLNNNSDVDNYNVTFPANFTIPRFLSMSAYNEELAQSVNYKLIQSDSSLRCSSEKFIVSASLVEKNANNSDLENQLQQINFTIEGYLKYGKDYFAPNEYCINGLNETTISAVICSTNLNCNVNSSLDSNLLPANPCIRRCCEFGEAYDISGMQTGQRIECKPSGIHQWKPVIVGNTPYTKLTDNEKVEILPHIISSHPRDGWCDFDHAVMMSLNKKYKPKPDLVRILKDGTFIHKFKAQTWGEINKQHICIDGGQNYKGYFDPANPGYYSGEEQDTLIINCDKPRTEQAGIESVSTLYGTSMLICSIFLFLTILVYFLLWEKQNVHGWTLLCYIISLQFVYISMVIMHFSNTLAFRRYNNGVSSTPCFLIAIFFHFFFLSTFCWLTTINFDLWWTFKVLKPTTGKSKGLKRFIFYALFAVGVPILIVSIGTILDSTYRDNIENDIIIPLYGITRCYLDPGKSMLAYVYGPVGVLLVINLLFFIFTIISMYKIQQSTKFASASSSKNEKQRQSVKLFLKLFIIMGVTWIFEVISWLVSGYNWNWYWVVFDMINILQAIVIFIIFVCKKETISSLEQKYPSFKNVTHSMKLEDETFNSVTTRFPKLKGILAPFRKNLIERNDSASQRTNISTADSITEVEDATKQNYEMTPTKQQSP